MLLCLVMMLAAPPALGEQVLAEFDWSDRGAPGELFIDNPGGRPGVKRLLTIEAPKIAADAYALRGQVRHQGVQGRAYLEMWSVFPDGGRYFTRTQASQGPMAALAGDGEWRAVVLPFSNKPGGPPPAKLLLNLAMPGEGRVWLGTFELVQFSAGENPLAAAANAWFGQATGGLVGAVAGSGLGLVAGLIGLLIGLGRGRTLAMGLLGVLLVAGIGALLVGLVAVLQSQPFAVCYPFLLLGGLGLVLSVVGLVVGRFRFRALELARMKAKDMAT